MAIEELNRTNIQALWRHMPQQPFNWPRKATVIGTNPKQVSPLNVPEGWVAPQLRRLIAPFAEAVSGTSNVGRELATIDGLLFELVQAEDLQAERFPNTFHCAVCGRFTTVNKHTTAPTCPSHGPMRQFTWAELHECGHLAPLSAPRCANNDKGAMALMNTRSLRTSRWYWKCLKCQTRSAAPVTRGCSTCRTGRVRIDRVPRNETYYPQTITVLNPPTRNEYSALAHGQVHAAAVAQSLGILKPGLEGLRQAAGASPDDVVKKFEETMLAIGLGAGDPAYDAGMAKAQATAAAGSTPAWRGDVDALGLDEETLESLGEECRQLSLARGAAELTVAELAESAKGSPLAGLYDQYPAMFADHGLAEVTLLRQLPIAYVVAGYTRNASKAVTMRANGPSPTHFKFFTGSKSGKMRMYGVRTETEGLLFRLDPLKVVTWLVESGLVDDQNVTTVEQAQRWLFRMTSQDTDVFNPPDDQITKAVLGLVHSFAHRAMKALAARCGLNVDSLAEFLFPANASFLLYANTRSQFVLGGLEHVFRYDLPDAFAELASESRCMFDPPCRTSFGGSCAACLHVSEVACQRFNTVLDRNLLFGTLPPLAGAPAQADPPVGAGGRNVTWQPYWTG